MAEIRQRGESWRVEWRRGGRGGTRESTTWPTEPLAKQAKEIAEAHRHNITADDVYDAILGTSTETAAPLGPTVREWSEKWVKTRTRISPGQRRRYQHQLDQRILPALGDYRLTEVTGTHVATLLQELRATLKDTTVTRYFAVIHSLLGYALLEKEVDDNPARRTDFIRDIIAHDDDSDGEDHVYLEPEEFERIRSFGDPMTQDVLDLLVDTGLRWSEATALQVSAYAAAGGRQKTTSATLKIHRAWKTDEAGKWYAGTPKGRKRRTITIGTNLAVGVIARRIDGKAKDALILRAARGGRVNYSNFANRHFNPAVEAAMRCDEHPPDGIQPSKTGVWPAGAISACDCAHRLKQRPTIHDLRHTHVAWLIAAGKPIAAISRRLGHSSTAVTEQVYAGIMPRLDDEMADAIDEMRRPQVAAA